MKQGCFFFLALPQKETKKSSLCLLAKNRIYCPLIIRAVRTLSSLADDYRAWLYPIFYTPKFTRTLINECNYVFKIHSSVKLYSILLVWLVHLLVNSCFGQIETYPSLSQESAQAVKELLKEQYSIQMGAYHNYDNAVQHFYQLSEQYLKTVVLLKKRTILDDTKTKKVLWLVQIGVFKNRADARQWETEYLKMRAKGVSDFFVVKSIHK